MRHFHIQYLVVGAVLAVVIFVGSLLVFPASGQSLGLVLALVVLVVTGVTDFVANWRQAFEATKPPSLPPFPQIQAQDLSAGRDNVIATGNVQTGGIRIQGPVAGGVVVWSGDPELERDTRYIEWIQKARSRLKQGRSAQPDTAPLSYVQWIRPDPLLDRSPQEFEVRVALVNHVPDLIRVISALPPEEIQEAELIGPFEALCADIPPFDVRPALRYVVPARLVDLAKSKPPRMYYCRDGKTELLTTLSECPSGSTPDYESLFVPLIDRDDFRQIERQWSVNLRKHMIVGEWGKGRSRVLAECVRAARRNNYDILEKAAFPSMAENERCDPIREAIYNRLGVVGEWTEPEIVHLVQWLVAPDQDRLGDHVILAFAGYLTGKPVDPAVVAHIILQRACIQPVFLAVDDLHYAPDFTFQVFQRIEESIHRFPRAHLVICATCERRGYLSRSKLLSEGWHTSHLNDLNEKEVYEFVRYLFPNLHSPTQESLMRLLDGRPLVVRQVMRCLNHAGKIYLRHGTWRLSDLDRDAGIQHVLSELDGHNRLTIEYDELWDKDRILAQGLRLAAALGVEFDYNLWQQTMLELGIVATEREADDCVENLKRKEFVRSWSETTYRIDPPALAFIIREQIRADPIVANRVHGAAVRVLSRWVGQHPDCRGQFASQLLLSQSPEEMPRAFKLFCQMAASSFFDQNIEQTVALYQRACEAARSAPDKIPELLTCRAEYKLAEALGGRGYWAEAKMAAHQLATRCEQARLYRLAAEGYILAGWACQKLGEPEAARDHYELADRLIQAHALPNKVKAYLLRKRAVWYSEQKRNDLALQCYESARCLPQAAQDLVQTLSGYADTLRLEHHYEAADRYIQLAMQVCAKSRRISDLYRVGPYLNAGIISFAMKRYEASLRYLEEALRLSRAVGAIDRQGWIESWFARIYRIQDGGPSSRAIKHCDDAIMLLDLTDNKSELVFVFREWITALLDYGKSREALTMCKEAALRGITDPVIDQYREVATKNVELERKAALN